MYLELIYLIGWRKNHKLIGAGCKVKVRNRGQITDYIHDVLFNAAYHITTPMSSSFQVHICISVPDTERLCHDPNIWTIYSKSTVLHGMYSMYQKWSTIIACKWKCACFFIIMVMFMPIGRPCHTIVNKPFPYPLKLCIEGLWFDFLDNGSITKLLKKRNTARIRPASLWWYPCRYWEMSGCIFHSVMVSGV